MRFQVPCEYFQAPCSRFQAPCDGLQVPLGICHAAPWQNYMALGSIHMAFETYYTVLGHNHVALVGPSFSLPHRCRLGLAV
eukprot:11156159-Lingulodinium_polyedra.AAC.1